MNVELFQKMFSIFDKFSNQYIPEITVASFSEAGQHPINEDAFIVEHHPSDTNSCLCFLADGQGGSTGGAEAAQLACRVAADLALKETLPNLRKSKSWVDILQQVDSAVSANPLAGYTTLIGFCISKGVLVGASSGDSAIFLRSYGRKEVCELTKNQEKNPAVGSTQARFIPFFIQLTDPWLVLAMSDGVWKYVEREWLYDSMIERRGQKLTDWLYKLALLNGNGKLKDDFTLVAIEGR